MSTNPDDALYEKQLEIFDRLAREVEVFLDQFGDHDSFEPGDYSIYDGYWGFPQIKVTVLNLKMLEPAIVEGLQKIIKAYPGWEIVVAVGHRDHYDDWPEMGLYIRPHEIIDGLQRQYFPKEFQHFEYKTARPGAASD